MRNRERQRFFTYVATILGCVVTAAGIGIIMLMSYML
jgi:type IV secretory pathway component VirB8